MSAVDLKFDVTTDGRALKIASMVEHTRECLGGLVERSVTADILIDQLDVITAGRGYPAVLRCDNGPELASFAWPTRQVNASAWPSSRTASGGVMGYIESFNGRVRDEP